MTRSDPPPTDFHGAKAAVFIGDRLLVIQRDDFAHIPFPGFWDFPGGGRENEETPMETLFREVHEELGLMLEPAQVVWSKCEPAAHRPDSLVWFFVVQLPVGSEAGIVFGHEGQSWDLMTPETFLDLPDAVPSLAPRLRLWLGGSD
jgi:8-oxo-dGTP diphosphatase